MSLADFDKPAHRGALEGELTLGGGQLMAPPPCALWGWVARRFGGYSQRPPP